MKKIASLLLLLLVCFVASSQENAGDQVEMADALRSNGKIYVVVAVVIVILLGLFVYLWRLDRKISKLERDIKS
jgi:CcmD family protein